MKKVVVVAPTFNEADNIGSFLAAVLSQEKNLPGWQLSILISDSHSTDQTAEFVKKFSSEYKNIHYLDVQKRGLGLGLTKGLDYAVEELRADVLVTMEADLSNDPNQLPDFIRKIGDADVVIGSRYSLGGRVVNWSWWRRMMSLGANLALRVLAGWPNIHEFTNLYRAFRKGVWESLRLKVSLHRGWIFVPAFAFEILGNTFKIVEQPILYFDRFGGRSKMRTISYTKNLLLYAIRFRLEKSASVFKFAVVGAVGFVINTVVLILGVALGLRPSVAGPLGAELAIIQGFTLNNFWTFGEDRLTSWAQVPFKFTQYNVIALGSVVIQFLFLRSGESIFGLERFKGPMVDWPAIKFYTWYMFFYMWGVGVGMVWNYILYRTVVWRKLKKIKVR